MDHLIQKTEDNPDAPYVVRSSRSINQKVFLASLVAVLFGIALEFVVYPRMDLAPHRPVVVTRLNGWWFTGIGSVTLLGSAYLLLIHPILIQVDSYGITSTLHSIRIPWGQVIAVRRVKLGVLQLVMVQVRDTSQIDGGVRQRKRYANLKELASDEIPVSITTPDRPPDEILNKLNAEIAKRLHPSNHLVPSISPRDVIIDIAWNNQPASTPAVVLVGAGFVLFAVLLSVGVVPMLLQARDARDIQGGIAGGVIVLLLGLSGGVLLFRKRTP